MFDETNGTGIKVFDLAVKGYVFHILADGKWMAFHWNGDFHEGEKITETFMDEVNRGGGTVIDNRNGVTEWATQ